MHKVLVDELRVDQLEPRFPQPCHQVAERHLAGVRLYREHALPEKRAADHDAVKAPCEIAFLVPRLGAGGIALAVKFRVKRDNLVVDPRVRPRIGAGADDGRKIAAERNLVMLAPQRLHKPFRNMEMREVENAAENGVEPAKVLRVARLRHREKSLPVGFQHDIGCDFHRRL